MYIRQVSQCVLDQCQFAIKHRSGMLEDNHAFGQRQSQTECVSDAKDLMKAIQRQVLEAQWILQ